MLEMKCARIKLLIVDVDGTLTDAGIYYDEHGNELKKFCTKDAVGFFAAREAGIKTMIITGRECEATKRRMTELNVDYLFQKIDNKADFIKEYLFNYGLAKEDTGYIGDDLNDISAMKMCGFIGCPYDSCAEVKMIADYVSAESGGHGAVRDVVEYILKTSNRWDDIINRLYYGGV